jgi:hypothetical protein
LPALEVGKAVFAGADECAFWVVICILVEWNNIGRVCIAKYVAATATVVSTSEICEISGAGGFVADGRFGIGLQKRTLAIISKNTSCTLCGKS